MDENAERTAVVSGREDDLSFLPNDRMGELRGRWSEIQAGFVDDPRASVKDAHDMVAEVVNELTETFTRERTNLEGQWTRDEEPDTEALRVALQRYRSFFNRLLGSSPP
jgi:hypothetical protein